MELDIGIPEKDRQEITLGLSRLLSDTYSLYLKSHYYHWNVTGPMFQALYLMFEAHETVAHTARSVFPIAERAKDAATVDILPQRLHIHDKTA